MPENKTEEDNSDCEEFYHHKIILSRITSDLTKYARNTGSSYSSAEFAGCRVVCSPRESFSHLRNKNLQTFFVAVALRTVWIPRLENVSFKFLAYRIIPIGH